MTAAAPDAAVGSQQTLIAALQRPDVYEDHVSRVTLLETHISYVLLTGPYAYKIKKSVDLGFLNFTALEARRRYCEEEIRLNRRLAPDIYLDVVPIAGTPTRPILSGPGPAIEYAVRMREFPQESLLSRMLSMGTLRAGHIDALAARVADFHAAADVAPSNGRFGRPHDIHGLALDNFRAIEPLLTGDAEIRDVAALRDWSEREYRARLAVFDRRRRDGFVRECHGDLHLGNIAWVDDAATVFDCIEFNDEMRWGDVLSEVAFTVMDLEDRGRSDLAFRYVNAYLERTGDYAGLAVFRFYLVYRAMVRAKVGALSRRKAPAGGERAQEDVYRGYLALATRYTNEASQAIVVTNGVAGSGKSTAAGALAESIGAIRIRTDIERKRLHGLAANARTGSPLDAGLYAADATERTYRAVGALVRHVAAGGFVAIVDGTFLKRWQRDLFRGVAREMDIPFVILRMKAGLAAIRQRLVERGQRRDGPSEADGAVLEHQLGTLEEITGEEADALIEYDAEAATSVAVAAARAAIFDRIR